jgi:hypothetical protein
MDISLIPVRVYASRRGAVNASGGRFIVSDSVRRHPNKFAMTERRLFVLLRVRCPGAIDLGLGGVPPWARPGNGLRKFCEIPQA